MPGDIGRSREWLLTFFRPVRAGPQLAHAFRLALQLDPSIASAREHELDESAMQVWTARRCGEIGNLALGDRALLVGARRPIAAQHGAVPERDALGPQRAAHRRNAACVGEHALDARLALPDGPACAADRAHDDSVTRGGDTPDGDNRCHGPLIFTAAHATRLQRRLDQTAAPDHARGVGGNGSAAL